jgi:hypothetical protein
MLVRIILYVFATWLIAAHFLRAGNLFATALCLATPLLFLVRRRWSLLVLQALSYVSALVWLVTTWQLVAMRRAFGEPWLRGAAILFAVAAFSVLVGVLLRRRTLRERYRGR